MKRLRNFFNEPLLLGVTGLLIMALPIFEAVDKTNAGKISRNFSIFIYTAAGEDLEGINISGSIPTEDVGLSLIAYIAMTLGGLLIISAAIHIVRKNLFVN